MLRSSILSVSDRKEKSSYSRIGQRSAFRKIRFLRVHLLRTADALRLAAAFVAAERRPPSLEMVTLDDPLANAARRGFAMIDLTPVD